MRGDSSTSHWGMEPDDTYTFQKHIRKSKNSNVRYKHTNETKQIEEAGMKTEKSCVFSLLSHSSDPCRVLFFLCGLSVYLVARLGHIYLEGFPVDALGSTSVHPDVSDVFRSKRVARDGAHYHCTIIHAGQVEQARQIYGERRRNQREQQEKQTERQAETSASATSPAATTVSSTCDTVTSASSTDATVPSVVSSSDSPDSSLDSDLPSTREFESYLVDLFSSRLSTPIFEFGVGRATLDGNTAYFVVLDWPQANQIREELGLTRADLHVTIGFNQNDCHGVSKNKYTLCDKKPK